MSKERNPEDQAYQELMAKRWEEAWGNPQGGVRKMDASSFFELEDEQWGLYGLRHGTDEQLRRLTKSSTLPGRHATHKSHPK